MSSFEELEKLEKRGTSDGTDALEVSYAVLSSSTDNPIDLLEKFATTINVQLTLHPGQVIPFIPFNGLERAKNANKLFLYGTSGSGKSRCIYEIVRERIADFKNIFIISVKALSLFIKLFIL